MSVTIGMWDITRTSKTFILNVKLICRKTSKSFSHVLSNGNRLNRL